MNDSVKKLLSVKDENNKYIFEAKDVSEFHKVSLNAVYNSRKVGDKLDRLMAFSKMQEAIEKDEKNTISISGEKESVINGLKNILSEEVKYEINYREI